MKKSIFLIILFVSIPNIQAQKFKFKKVSEEEVMEKQHPKVADADAAILYREIESNIEYSDERDFYVVTEVFERIKIYTKEGFDWANRTIKLYQSENGDDESLSGLKGYTYFLKDGKVEEERLRNEGIFEEKTSDFLENVKFTMPNISEGCVIEYRYTITSPFIGNIDEYRLQETIPVDKVKISFTAPEYLNYKKHIKGWLPVNVEEDKKDGIIRYSYTSHESSTVTGGSAMPKSERVELNVIENIYRVNLENIPPIHQEPFCNNIDNYTASIKFELSYTKFPNRPLNMFTQNWDDVSKSIYQASAFGKELQRTGYFEDDLDKVLEGIKSPSEKIIAVFEFVKHHMNWNSYHGLYTNQGTKKAYLQKKGNAAEINLMLVSMLRHAGISANPVLVSSKSNGIPIFPTKNGFNFVLAAVENQNSIILLDATHKDSEPNILQEELLNWQGRLVREDGSSVWVPLYPKEQAEQNAMFSMKINTDGMMVTGKANNRFTGHYAMNYRSNFKGLSLDAQRSKIEEGWNETEITEMEFKSLDKLYNPVALKYSFENFDAIEEIGGKLYVSPMVFLSIKENPFKIQERNYPIDFGYPIKDRYIINIAIPEGYTVESIPQSTNFVLGSDIGHFKYLINENAGQIQLSVEMVLNNAVLPSEVYPDLKKFFQMVVEKENEKIVLTKA